jgi:DNA replication protein DnaC
MDAIIDEIFRRYDIVRYRNERLLHKRTEEVYEKCPGVRDIEGEIGRLRSSLFRLPIQADAFLHKIDSLMEQKKALLKESGYPEDYLEPIYDCALCRDTGTDVITGARCACFQKSVMHERFRELPVGCGDASFENFDLALFPDDTKMNGLTQRQMMRELKVRCEKYADDFPDTEKKNILLVGPSGLGKTYLLNCILKRITLRGFHGLFIPAYRLFDAFWKRHLDEVESLDAYYEAPVLMIDDLGTEPLIKNVTSEYFFSLLNERMKNGLHTLFATNFSPQGLMDRYGERIISRILSVGETDTFALTGKDVRLFGQRE